jgi:hypothetical protein
MNWKQPSEEKADLAAQASSKCEKCFHTVPSGATTCPECGATVKNASVSDSEAAIYPELARANLARMRGDYKQAEDQLLTVLKRYPNNPSANEMLGDLAAEREDYVHAVEWYEMALEIVPTSASIARKAKDARSRIDNKNTQDTTAQLGLSDPSSRMPLIVFGLIFLIVAVGVGAYFLGARGGAPPKPGPTMKIQAQPDQQAQTSGGSAEGTPIDKPATAVAEDDTLKQTLTAKAEDAPAIIAVTHDPRAGSVTVTFSLSGQDDRALAARLARATFTNLPGYNKVVLRGIREGKVAYMADSDRTRVAETETPEWKQQHDATAWIPYVLQNEWPPVLSTPSESTGGTGIDLAPNTTATSGGNTGTTDSTGGGQ